MSRPPGRPMKYAHFLAALEDDLIYTPATIVRHGESLGFFKGITNKKNLAGAKLKVRHTLARFSTNHGFPREGDGWVLIEGQAPLRGWLGQRWKASMNERYGVSKSG